MQHLPAKKKGILWLKFLACHAKADTKMGTEKPCWALGANLGGYIGLLGTDLSAYLEADLGAMRDHVAFPVTDLETMR